jgi:hypothetical protein
MKNSIAIFRWPLRYNLRMGGFAGWEVLFRYRWDFVQGKMRTGWGSPY